MPFGILGTCPATRSLARGRQDDDLSLDDHTLDNVPGTGLLSAKGNKVMTGGGSELKRGTGKHAHIVLIPQPSDDPHDPYVLVFSPDIMCNSICHIQ